jgi:leucyl/phenylalanyl-tRNA--protein transferase
LGRVGIYPLAAANPGGVFRRYIPGVAIYRLPRKPVFPDPRLSEPDGLLAVGGDLSEERLLRAYAEGIFPWYGPGSPILWWSPDPRMVLLPDELHLPRSLRRALRSGRFEVRLDTAFDEVVHGCASRDRPGQDGTWITPDMARAYGRLHRRGLAHSAEAWEGDVLAGGLYGVSLGGTFFGESMYADRADASKVAFATLLDWLVERGFDLVDCQVETEHLRRFGAREVNREEFLERLAASLRRPTREGPWRMDR